MRRTAIIAALSFALCMSCSTTGNPGNKPVTDTIFIAGHALIGAEQTPRTSVAIVVRDGRIAEIGDASSMRAKFADANVVDYSGATILPGLIDAHGHLYGLGLALDTVDVVDTTSIEDIGKRVTERASSTTATEWITGRGWDQNDWSVREFPTATQLDAFETRRPVWLKRIDGHAGWANSAALRAAGITRDSKDPDGGKIIRDERGEPTGVFIDAAMDLVEAHIPVPSFEVRKRRVLRAAENIAENGLTGMHDAGADPDTIRAVRELIDEGKFPIRVQLMISDDAKQLTEWFARGPLVGYGDRLTVRSVKIYGDGALGSRGAALLAPYSDDAANTGLILTPQQHIEDAARRGAAAGFQINTHAIGDRGVRMVLDAYESAGVRPEHRFRIEHFQVAAPADIPRAARLGVIASMQPTHATSDMPWAETRLGSERTKGAYAWRSVLDAGGRLALGSDFPVEAVSPFYGLHSSVTRQDFQGRPPGGWYPQQKLSLAEAIRGFTIDAAWAAFDEKQLGTIEVGKFADFTVVDGDFMSVAPKDIYVTMSRATVVGGRVVHGRQ
jgi:predicted amidohydrolase YtcJ